MSGPAKYTILRKIADGGMAEIFLAELSGPQGFKKQVVLKQIRPRFSDSRQFRNLLLDEAHVAMSLNHGNIVQVLDLGEIADKYFLALELVDGWSLDQLLRRARAAGLELPRELSLFIVAAVCRALAYAHSMSRDGEPLGIVHRDVSPQNVLVSEQGEVKLTDFGIAKARNRSEQTAEGTVKGKLAYMSPEQTVAAPLDLRSDLFSLGTVLYEMISGRLPFQGASALETMMQVQACKFPPPGKVTRNLEPEIGKLILGAMRRNPRERFQSAEEMLHATEGVLRKLSRHAGQTELKRWLVELGAKDHVPPISRVPAKAPEDEPSAKAWLEVGASSIVPSTLPGEKGPVFAPQSPPPFPKPRGFGGKRLLLGGTALCVAGWLAVRALLAPEESPRTVLPIAEVPPLPYSPPPLVLAEELPVTGSEPALAPVEDAGLDAGSEEEVDEEGLLKEAIADPARAVITAEGVTVEQRTTKPKVAAAPAAVAPAADTVSVLIQSEPKGAIVQLDSRVFGRTPIPLRFRSGITFELTLVKSGYSPVKKRFLVTKRTGQKVFAVLKKAPAKRRQGK